MLPTKPQNHHRNNTIKQSEGEPKIWLLKLTGRDGAKFL